MPTIHKNTTRSTPKSSNGSSGAAKLTISKLQNKTVDSVTIKEARSDETKSPRALPNLAWASASETLDSIASTGKKLWDSVAKNADKASGPIQADPEAISEGWEALKDRAGDVWDSVKEAVSGDKKTKTPTPGPKNEPAPKTERLEKLEKNPEPQKPTLQGLPARPENAKTGSKFMDSIKHLKPGPERDKAVLKEIMSGNIPDSARNLKEVTVRRKGKDGKMRELKMHVMPDYLSIGSDKDSVRIPMTPAVAQAIADKTGTSLPTDRMVDDIQSKSKKLHMAPFQWKPGRTHADNMKSIDYYQKHDQRIDDQLGTGQAQTELVSGHKKDLVIPAKNGRVAIYGGRWPGSGKRVQPYSNKHFDIYADYSHGVRLVSQEVTIDGKKMKLKDVLADPNLAPLVTRFPATGAPGALNNRYEVPEHLR